MDSKEAIPNPVSDNSSGSSFSPSSYSDEKDNLSPKNIYLKGDNDYNSRSDGVGGVCDDEDEGGYASGKEEFENPGLVGLIVENVGEVAGEGNSDGPFADAPEILMEKDDDSLLVSGISAIAGDDVENGNKVVLVEDSKGVIDSVGEIDGIGISVVEDSDGKGEILDSVEKLDGNSVEGGVETGYLSKGDEEFEAKSVETEVKGEIESYVVNKPEADDVAVVVPEEVKVVSPGDVKLTPEGDSVVDSIQVDTAGPGVVVVGEMEDNSGGKDDSVESIDGTDESTVGVAREVGVFADESTGDVKLTPEGDSVVDTIQVDIAGPGVAVVGDTGENGGENIKGVDFSVESVDEPDPKPLQHLNHAVGVVNDEKIESDVSNGITMKIGSEEIVGTDRDVNQFENLIAETVQTNGEHDPRAHSYVDGLDDGVSEKSKSVLDPKEDEEENESDGEVDPENHVVVVEKDKKLEPNFVSEAIENDIITKIGTEGDVNHLENSIAEIVQANDEHDDVNVDSEKSKLLPDLQEITEQEDEETLSDPENESDTDGTIFGSSEAAKKFIEELEQESGPGSSQIDGQIVTDSEEEADTDEEGDGKELFDPSALAALLKAATGVDSDSGSITFSSQDGSRLFSVERPAGLGSSLRALRPAPRPNQPNFFAPSTLTESEENLSEEEKTKLEKLQKIRVKFLRLVHRLGLSPEESVAAQVLYRLALLGGRQGTQTFSLDAAKRTALQLEAEERGDLDFSINILVLGKSGVGKSATINSIFGEEKAPINAFGNGTVSSKGISGILDGVKVNVIDMPGLKSSVMEQSFNRAVLSSVKKFTKRTPPDVVLYVDRLDAQTRDLNDLPLLKTVSSILGPSIWRSAIVTLTHAASAPPDGPSGTPLSYEVFVTQRSHQLQQSIGHAVGDLRMMSPSLMNPVSLVENHPNCRKNREGQKILPNGQIWRPQLLLLCYSMKILSEASSLSKPQDPFDHRKLFGFRARSPPLPYMLSSILQSRAHPKLPDQGGDNVDSDVDLDDLSDSDQEEEDEYDQLPPFKPLKRAQVEKLTKEQKKAYFEEYDYRAKLLQKKQWKDELRRIREMKKNKDFALSEQDPDADGAAAPVAVPLPDMALPPSFDGDNPAYRYRFLEPTSQFLARPVLDSHGWDHDCGYDGVNLEHTLALANRFPAVYTIQITKDKKDFTFSLDSSVSAKHGENFSTMAGFDIQSMGKQVAYIVRGETKSRSVKKHKAAGGFSVTFLGENVVPGIKVEDQITLGKRYVLTGSAGGVKSRNDTAYGANFELQRRELDYPIGQVQSTFSVSIIKWKGDLALGFNSLAQFSIGRNSKVAVRAGVNNKMSGQVTVKTSSSDHLSLALAAIVPTVISIYKKLWPGAGEKYGVY